MKREFDVIVIGAGVIGSAVARSLLLRKKAKSVALIEKEPHPALHSSGRNSGVVHSGFNLKPGSLKAKYCVEGNARLRDYCAKKNIPLKEVGTLVVGHSNEDRSVLDELLKRGKENGVPEVQLINQAELQKKEPHAAGQEALFSPTGSIVSGKIVTHALVNEVKELGGTLFFNSRVRDIQKTGKGFDVRLKDEIVTAPFLINCAGLYADEVAHRLDVGKEFRIIPFRGDYYRLREGLDHILNSMLYPVPDLVYPFLGVHWTKSIDGYAMIGPCAAIAFGRESYHPLKISFFESVDMLMSSPFLNLVRSAPFRKMAWAQMKLTLSRTNFINEARKLIPSVQAKDFVRGKSGNRAQLVDEKGNMVDDIQVVQKDGAIHVLNAVSPGFTCSLPFADYITDQLSGN